MEPVRLGMGGYHQYVFGHTEFKLGKSRKSEFWEMLLGVVVVQFVR